MLILLLFCQHVVAQPTTDTILPVKQGVVYSETYWISKKIISS
jgi:hypothetical protein